jgi:hypothetical protein
MSSRGGSPTSPKHQLLFPTSLPLRTSDLCSSSLVIEVGIEIFNATNCPKIKKVDSKTGKVKFYPKHRKLITNCSHWNQEYYAKGMCKNCYHNKGQKSKKAFMCPHSSKSHYARGLCKNCYLYHYHQNKKSSECEKLAELSKKPSE